MSSAHPPLLLVCRGHDARMELTRQGNVSSARHLQHITLQRRADYSVTLQFKDATATPINLTGWTVAAQVWNKARSTKYADFTVTYTNVSTGTIAIALTDDTDDSLPR
jgi:hypothetical protein